MPSSDRHENAIARVYASAMFEAAEGDAAADDLLEELRDLASYMEKDEAFAQFITSARVDATERKKVVDKLFRGKYSDLFLDSLQVLNQRERLELLPQIAKAYYHLHKEARGRVEVEVVTAVPLNDALRARLRELAGRYTGREADLVERTDESLIAGLVMQIGDQKFDTSARRRIKILHDMLLDRASRELHSGRTYLEGSVTGA